MREAQVIERLGLPEATLCSITGGEPPELDEARLVGMQLQGERREPFAKIMEELLGVTTMRNPTTKSSAERVMIMSPRALRRLHCRTHRSKT